MTTKQHEKLAVVLPEQQHSDTATLVKEASLKAAYDGIATARQIWGKAPVFLPILAAVFYGLGRLFVDGFYSHLDTTASAAGVSTISILEPVAILAAITAFIGTALLMIYDVLKGPLSWIVEKRKTLGRWLILIACGAAFGACVYVFRLYTYLIPILSGFFAVAAQVATRQFKGRKSSTEKPSEGAAAQAAANSQQSDSDAKTSPRVALVTAVCLFMVGLCVGAHVWGAHEANRVQKGEGVNILEAGLNITSVSPVPVYVQAIDSSPVIKQLSADGCLLEIGSNGPDLLFYDVKTRDTLTVPSDDVVTVSASLPCTGK